MHVQPRLRRSVATIALVMAVGGCGSSSEPTSTPDSSVGRDASSTSADTRVAGPDGSDTSDAVGTGDTATNSVDADAASDTGAAGLDGPMPGIDGGQVGWDASVSEAGGLGVDAASSRLDTGGAAGEAGGQGDGSPDFGGSQADGPSATADAGFVPGPATPIVVNSGPTGQFSLSDGTWKIFYFDAVATQVYAVSELSGIVHGYVSTSSSVSPSNYQFVTNADGNLSFMAPAAQRYYIAVSVSGGGVSGSFQVADGGTKIALGSTPLALTAPDGDNTYFFRFPITAGHGYTFSAAGPAQPSIKIAAAPRAERSSNGQFSYSIWGVGGSLPFTGYDISAAAAATSYSGFCFFYINVTAAMTVTVTIAESS